MRSISSVALLAACHILVAQCAKEILLDFDSGTLKPADFIKIDQDSNGLQPTLEFHGNTTMIRSATMPKTTDHKADQVREDNWVFFPYITNSVKDGVVELTYIFNHEKKCPTYSPGLGPVQCKDNITLLLVPDTGTVADKSLYGTAAKVVNIENADPGDIWSKSIIINLPSGNKGYRLVLHDEGSSYLLKSLKLKRLYCHYNPPAGEQLPVICPNKPASATGAAASQAECVCKVLNSKPSSGRKTLTESCVFDSKSSDAVFKRSVRDIGVKCDCPAPAFTYTKAADGSRHCKARAVTAATSAPQQGSSGPSTIQSVSTKPRTGAPRSSSKPALLSASPAVSSKPSAAPGVSSKPSAAPGVSSKSSAAPGVSSKPSTAPGVTLVLKPGPTRIPDADSTVDKCATCASSRAALSWLSALVLVVLLDIR